jgi:hypothetical protein
LIVIKRYVVRNVYAFDLDIERVARLIKLYPDVWYQFEQDIQAFVQWLRALALKLEE